MTFGFLLVTCIVGFGTYWFTKYALMPGNFYTSANLTVNNITKKINSSKVEISGDDGQGSGDYRGSGDAFGGSGDFGGGSGFGGDRYPGYMPGGNPDPRDMEPHRRPPMF